MLSILLAWFLLWVLYLWLDRQRLRRIVSPLQPPPEQTRKSPSSATQKTSSQPQFPNSKPISEINRERRRAKQVPPDAPKKPPQQVVPPQINQLPESVPETPPAQPRSESVILPKTETNFDALQREAGRRKEDLCRVSAKTQNQLYRLVHNDRAMVERLVKHSRSRHPDRPEQWIWEKTIQDLERDRGYR